MHATTKRPSTVHARLENIGTAVLAGLWIFILIAIAVQCLRTDLNWQEAPLSFYLLDAWGHWLQAAYVVLSLSLVLLGGGFYAGMHGQQRSMAPSLLFACSGIALCVTAFAHSNLPGRPPTLEGFVHGTAAQAAFLCVSVAMLLQSWWLRASTQWHRHFPLAFALALAGFAAIWMDALWHGMPRGLEQRLVIGLLLWWLLLAAGWLRRQPPRSR